MEITRQQCSIIQQQINDAVNAIFAEHNLEATATSGRAKYGEMFEIKLQAVPCADHDGVNEHTPEARDYFEMGSYYGLDDDVLGTSFVWGDKHFTFVGIRLRAKKFPICAKGEDGKNYGLPEQCVDTINRASLLAKLGNK